jgi:hypothetical protein
MKHNNITMFPNQNRLIIKKKRIAFHLAGHAAGIYLNNKAKQLPPVFFKILSKNVINLTESDLINSHTTNNSEVEHINGGRLIEFLPPSIESLIHKLSDHNDHIMQLVKDYMVAFDTDIINLIIGPLSEAKYIAETDHELFNQRLINPKALENYGGRSDMSLVNDYLQSLSVDKQQRDDKLNELFTHSFHFVTDVDNWKAITRLANYIFDSHKNFICCEETIPILDQSLELFLSPNKSV